MLRIIEELSFMWLFAPVWVDSAPLAERGRGACMRREEGGACVRREEGGACAQRGRGRVCTERKGVRVCTERKGRARMQVPCQPSFIFFVFSVARYGRRD